MAVDISDKLLKQGYIQNATSDNQDATSASDSGIYKDMNAQQTLPDGIEMDNKGTIKGDLGYKANAEGWLNTGTGAAAATWENNGKVEGGYSWDQKGASQASKQYQMDAMTQLQENLKQRQSIEEQIGVQQQAADMMQYQKAQDAEKLGWTGGYVLDQNTKMEYMKASIAAQMYSAIELNKYAQDVGLAAARLSYELNQEEYALKYYQEAQQAAFNEAQTTGTYFSAEVKDMMGQYAAAQKDLDDPSASERDKQRAELIQKSIVDWFGTNQISPNGVKEISFWNSEVNNTLSLSRELFTRYQAALEVAQTTAKESATTFVIVDRNGNPIYTNGSVQTMDMSTATPKQLLDYVVDTEGQHNSLAQSQLYSYLNWMVRDVLDKHDTDDAIDYVGLQTDLDNTINKTFKDLKEEADKTENKERKTLLNNILQNYSFTASYKKIDTSRFSLPNQEPQKGEDGGSGDKDINPDLFPNDIPVAERNNNSRITNVNYKEGNSIDTLKDNGTIEFSYEDKDYLLVPQYDYENTNPVVDKSKGDVKAGDMAVVNVNGEDRICIAGTVKGDDAGVLRWFVLKWNNMDENNTSSKSSKGSYNILLQQLKDKNAYGAAQGAIAQPTKKSEASYKYTLSQRDYGIDIAGTSKSVFNIYDATGKKVATIEATRKGYASKGIKNQLKTAGYNAKDYKGKVVKAQDGSYYLSDGISWIMLSGVTNGDLLMKAIKS